MTHEIKQLTQEEIKTFLNNLNNWILVENKIEKEFEFESFERAIEFVNQVATIAQEKNHHPDIKISYNKVTLLLQTHKIKSLTQSDFELAKEIDLLN